MLAIPARATSSDADHLAALDGVRGIAILLVLVFHALLVWGIVRLTFPTLWIDRFVIRVGGTGWAGVDLFFVLSGFLITRILLNARDGAGYFRVFYARRALRIFPLYYGFLILLIAILPWLPWLRDDAGLAALRHHQMEYWAYFFNIAASIHPFVDRGPFFHFWSLAVEEQFYLVWPFIVLVLGRRRLGVFCLLCIAAAPVVRFALLHGLVPESHGRFAAYLLMPARMDTLALGGLIAVVAMEPDLLRRAARWALPVGAISAAVVAGLYVHDGGFQAYEQKMQVFGYSAIALTFATFVTAVVGGPPGLLQRACGHPVLTFFGKYSYALYVVHFQIMLWVMHRADDQDAIRTVFGSYLPFLLVYTLVGVGLSVGVAWLSWHLYEKQFLKLKRFVPYGRPRERTLATRAAGDVALPAAPGAALLGAEAAQAGAPADG